MDRTDAFIEMLEEFEEFSKERTKQSEKILFTLGYIIGDRGRSVGYEPSKLKNKINSLVQNDNFDEKFLVDSLNLEVERIMQLALEDHGKSILENERQLRNFQDEGQDTSLFENALEKLKDPSYKYMLESEIHYWKVLKMNHYDEIKDIEWEYQKSKVAMERQIKSMESLIESLTEKHQHLSLQELKDKGIIN